MKTLAIDTPMHTERPVPPTREAVAALRSVPPATGGGPHRPFKFRQTYRNQFTNKGCKFVLRVEHAEEIFRLHNEFNKNRPPNRLPMSLSDVVTAALDFVFEHPISFRALQNPEQARDAIAWAVYRRALVHYLQTYESL